MTGAFATAIIAVALMLVVWALAYAALNRQLDHPLEIGVAVLEVMLLVFLVGGIVQMVGSDLAVPRWEVVAYLLGLAIIPPLGLAWASGEKSRSAMVVIAVACLMVPIMVVRVQQVWAGV